MKHMNMQQILQKRKLSKMAIKQDVHEQRDFNRSISKHIREVNDQVIDHLIKIVKKKESLSNENKLDLIEIIANKTGVHLNKHLMIEHINIVHFHNVAEVQQEWQKSRNSYFLLKGILHVYEQKQSEKANVKFNTQPMIKKYKKSYDQQQFQFPSIQQFQKHHTDYNLIQQMNEYIGIGQLFKTNLSQTIDLSDKISRKKLIAIDAIVAIISQTDYNIQSAINDGLTQEDKIELLNYYPIMRVIGKKLNSLISSFHLKQFSLKQVIYRRGQKPSCVYFILKGEVSFEFIIEQNPNDHQKHPLTSFAVNTETLGEPSYFGEEEFIFKTKRMQSAKVTSSNCIVLELEGDKFEKMMDNSEFAELVTKAAKIKQAERIRKIDKAREILQKQVEKKRKFQTLKQSEAKQLVSHEKVQSKRHFSIRRSSQVGVKLMHGHIVKQSPPKFDTVNFSMLGVNPDMYEAVKKKYRHIDAKPLEYDAMGSWDFKKVWKVLNLQEILQQKQVDLSAPEGRKYYDSHRRFQQQLNQTHSMRPKTTSSNYRTKLQYIAYLQQFNH